MGGGSGIGMGSGSDGDGAAIAVLPPAAKNLAFRPWWLSWPCVAALAPVGRPIWRERSGCEGKSSIDLTHSLPLTLRSNLSAIQQYYSYSYTSNTLN
uniref:Uncharacterized protein n=1 Tax=Oryza brachyantha TaxID=4533 RepID=J3MQK9_ORYBR